MDKKIYIQISIALTIVLLILYVYFFYFSSNEKKITKIDSNKDDLNIIKGTDDLISDMSYYSEDNKGNKYHIKCINWFCARFHFFSWPTLCYFFS